MAKKTTRRGARAATAALGSGKTGATRKKKTTKKGPGKKPAANRSGAKAKVKEFALQTCVILVNELDKRGRLEKQITGLKKQRKLVNVDLAELREEHDSTIAAEEKAGRDGKKAAFSKAASAKLIELNDDIDRKEKIVENLGQKLKTARTELAASRKESDRVVTEESPDGLFAEQG